MEFSKGRAPLLRAAPFDNRFPVAIAEGPHPFPFRTRKLSPPAPMVLQPRCCGRVGRGRGFRFVALPDERRSAGGRNSVVECQLPKLDVAGSSPVARSIAFRTLQMRPSVTCPTCRKPVPWHDNPYRPFCSERCRLIDLGAWVDESYRIPGEQSQGEDPPAPPDRT